MTMKFFKHMLALALAGALSVSLLTGCQKQPADVSGSASASGSGEQTATLDLSTVEDICVYLTGMSADEPMGQVNGQTITAGELTYWIVSSCENLSSYYYYMYGVSDLPWDEKSDDGEMTLADFLLADAMDYAVLQRLIAMKAQEMGLTVTGEEEKSIQTSLDAAVQNVIDDKVTKQQILWQSGLTEELYLWNSKCDILYDKLADAIFGKGGEREVTDKDVWDYLEQSKYYKVKHILLATVDTDSATREELDEKTVAEKKAKAEDLLAQLKASNDPQALFDQLMNEYSEDPGLKMEPEGYVFKPGDGVDPAFEAAALALKPGQISDIVEGVSGYHIILRLSLESELEKYKAEYINEQSNELFNEWLDAANVATTEEFKKVDVRSVYDKMTEFRLALQALAGDAQAEQ